MPLLAVMKGESADEALDNKVQDTVNALRILIVDQDRMSGDLLARALEHERIGEARVVQAADLMQAISGTQAGLVVLGADLRTELGNGFSLAGAVAKAHPEVSIVLLLARPTREAVINAFRAGAQGVFSRQRPISDFLDCVDRVRRRFIWASGQEAMILLQAFRTIPAPHILTGSTGPRLTQRELQVVQRAATGKTNKAIACELSLSEHTIKNYLFRAFEKLEVSSRIELLFYLTVNWRVTPDLLVENPGNATEEAS
jgi:two-component system, NarL family, nitrate/nitrite response regulator NarL